MSRLHLTFLQLILWTSFARILSCLKPPQLNILYLTDRPSTSRIQALLSQFENSLYNHTTLNRTIQIGITKVFLKKSSTFLEKLRLLNDFVNWEVTGIIILNLDDEIVQKKVLSGYRGLVFDIETRPKDMHEISYNLYTVKPSLTRLHDAARTIFGEIGYKKMHEVECFSRENSEVAKMKKTLENLHASTNPFIFVKCVENLDLVLQHGRETGLTTSEFRWVFPGVINLKEISNHLPHNVIAIDLPGSVERFHSVVEDNASFLGDVLNILEETLKNNLKNLLPEKTRNPARYTTSLKRYIVKEQFPGHTGEVIFDMDGQRSGEIYEIFELINFNGDPRWLPIGSLEQGNLRIVFNQWRVEDKIIELPVLRVVTRIKPPYIMFGKSNTRTSTGECEVGRVCSYFPNANKNVTTSQTAAELVTTAEVDYKCCIGLIMDLIERLEEDVGFKSKIHLVKDGNRGSNDPKTGKWNGMIGELIRDEADLAAYTLTITAKRSKVVDFTYPYADIASGILVSTKPVLHNVWDFVFLDTFSITLWLALFLSIQIVIGILWLAERVRKRRRFLNYPNKRDNSMSCAQIINYTWSLVFQKASEEVGPTTLGGRIVAALFAFCTIIACSSFTANLAAIKVTVKDGISITGIRDPKFQTGEITVGTLANSANLDFFRDSTDPSFQRIYQRIKGNLVLTYDDGERNILSRKWTAFIADTPKLAHMVSKQQDCSLKLAGEPFFFSGYGIALRKNSTWNTRLSFAITVLVREGFVTKLQAKWLGSGCGDVPQPGSEKMGVNDIGGAFLIVCFGCIASGMFLLLEYVVCYVLNRKDITAEHEARKQKHMDRFFGALAKAFALWDIDTSARETTNDDTTLKNFETLEIQPRKSITSDNEHQTLTSPNPSIQS